LDTPQLLGVVAALICQSA